MPWEKILAMRPAPMSWPDNLRLVAPGLLALAGLSLAGYFIQGLLVVLGAYIVLFGGNQPGRLRFRVYLIVSAFLLGAVSIGMQVSGSLAFTTLAYLLVALAAVMVNILHNLGPPGPYFFVLMVGGGALVGQAGMPMAAVLPFVAIGSGLAILFAMADAFYDPFRIERRAIGEAGRAVDELARAVDAAAGKAQVAPRDGNRQIDRCLRAAAAAIHQAWLTWLAGAGPVDDTQSRQLEQELRQLHRRYRERYLEIVERRLLPPGRTETRDESATAALDNMADIERVDIRHAALGEPAIRFRLAMEMRWPSATLITLACISAGIVLAISAAFLTRDRHSFWMVLVVVLVLSYPGSPKSLTLRAVQRFLGTSVGICLFALLGLVHMNQVAYVSFLCALLLIVSRITSRNYFYGSIFITLLALYLTLPLTPGQSPAGIAINRWIDTVIAVAISLWMIWIIDGLSTSALAKANVRRVCRAAAAVLRRTLERQEFSSPSFVENRRQLQYVLLRADRSDEGAGEKGSPYGQLEDMCIRLGYLALGSSWSPMSEIKREPLERMLECCVTIGAARDLDPTVAARDVQLIVNTFNQAPSGGQGLWALGKADERGGD